MAVFTGLIWGAPALVLGVLLLVGRPRGEHQQRGWSVLTVAALLVYAVIMITVFGAAH